MSNNNKDGQILRIAFYPWFALGHLTSFLRLANKLAERGHTVSYFLPTKTQHKLASQNHYPDHLTFIPVIVPPVDGLPPEAETTNDVAASAHPLLMSAMDLTRDTIEAHLAQLKPTIVFYDFAYWIPELGQKHGFKSVFYITSYIARFAYFAPFLKVGKKSTVDELMQPPPGFPTETLGMRAKEAESVAEVSKRHDALLGEGGGIKLTERFEIGLRDCDAIGVKTCKEMEGVYIEYVEKLFGKPVLLAGPMLPKSPSSKLDEEIDAWLNTFGSASVIYCALGSECVLEFNQFQELLLGLELTGAFILDLIYFYMNLYAFSFFILFFIY